MPPNPEAAPDAWVTALHGKLALRYGQRWTSQVPEDNRQLNAFRAEWAEALAGVTVDQIKHGLAAIRKSHPEWPPTQDAFAAACRSNLASACHRRYVALPKPTPDPKKGALALASMRKAVGASAV